MQHLAKMAILLRLQAPRQLVLAFPLRMIHHCAPQIANRQINFSVFDQVLAHLATGFGIGLGISGRTTFVDEAVGTVVVFELVLVNRGCGDENYAGVVGEDGGVGQDGAEVGLEKWQGDVLATGASCVAGIVRAEEDGLVVLDRDNQGR